MKYIFSFVDRDRQGIFHDLTGKRMRDRVAFLPSHIIYKNKHLNQLKSVMLSYQLNRFISVPFQSIFYNLESFPYKRDEEYCMIIPTSSIAKFHLNYLRSFRSAHPNVRLAALVTDSMHASSTHMDLVRDKLLSDVWTVVLTYDKYDAEEFGFQWFGYTYYSSFRKVSASDESSDLFYAGFVKGGREQFLSEIYHEMNQRGVNCNFKLVANLNKKQYPEVDLPYTTRRYSYPEVVSMTKSSNCILEVLQKGQEAQSLRYLEAIVYNKKLISNNPHLTELPFYNKENMRYIQTASDIDPDWAKAPCTIDYHYRGQFSPVHLLDFLDEYFDNHNVVFS